MMAITLPTLNPSHQETAAQSGYECVKAGGIPAAMVTRQGAGALPAFFVCYSQVMFQNETYLCYNEHYVDHYDPRHQPPRHVAAAFRHRNLLYIRIKYVLPFLARFIRIAHRKAMDKMNPLNVKTVDRCVPILTTAYVS